MGLIPALSLWLISPSDIKLLVYDIIFDIECNQGCDKTAIVWDMLLMYDIICDIECNQGCDKTAMLWDMLLVYDIICDIDCN